MAVQATVTRLFSKGDAMIPGVYDIEIYIGDTYYGPLITLPDLSPFGGPSTLATSVLAAQIRQKGKGIDPLATFDVELVDAATRKVRLKLDPSDTAGLTARNGVWDLQITEGSWVGTPLAGNVTFYREVTR